MSEEPDTLADIENKSATPEKRATEFLFERGATMNDGTSLPCQIDSFGPSEMNEAVRRFASFITSANEDTDVNSAYARLYRNDSDWNVGWTKS